MELQFQNKPLDCLRSILCCVKSQEQTQEVKLPEAMPDMAKVLGAWGQCVLRSKEWHSGRMGASGGVMVWVLYAPEDGTFPRVVEAWVPYQLQWELPQTDRDGVMIIQPLLKSVDARVISPRKLMVRACVEALGEALEPVRIDTYYPEQLPKNIYLLRKTYPMCIPSESGEKTVTLEEELQLPPECTDAGKLIRYCLHPQIQKQKLVGNRLLFRGVAILQGLCRCPEDRLCAFSYELPFSQYTELDREAGEDASVQVTPAVTDLELDILGEGKLRLKASLVGQYLVCKRKMLDIVEDAYSPGAQVQLQMQPLQLPAVLEMEIQSLQAEVTQEVDAGEWIDTAFYVGQPEQQHRDNQREIQLCGGFQGLYRNAEGALQSAFIKWEQNQQIPAADSTTLCIGAAPVNLPEHRYTAGSMQLSSGFALQRKVLSSEEIPMVTGLEVRPEENGQERPSLILRRAGNASLWEIAKEYGSTEEAIRQANGIAEPKADQVLLIPVM